MTAVFIYWLWGEGMGNSKNKERSDKTTVVLAVSLLQFSTFPLWLSHRWQIIQKMRNGPGYLVTRKKKFW